ncbi:MAG: pyruvate dehydrogenase complex dihydrolipoamide acetyltransferase [Gemmatimonadaceae bacterium]|jgi:pyruvate dehydrogenase E2 component (dihydrolipoamide acetyltransferase)|nr:pyruvate dehydrogenase complex dihydrolipoamide acetyltransferase [Gemmatimonadaceae bacterium]
MATKVMMEALSPTMEEGRLVKWNKAVGDRIAQGDVLAEVETDKAIMELVARGEGVLRARLIDEGDTIAVGKLIGVIAGADEDVSSLVGNQGQSESPPHAQEAGPTAVAAAHDDPAAAAGTMPSPGVAAALGVDPRDGKSPQPLATPVPPVSSDASRAAMGGANAPRTAMPSSRDHASEQAGHAAEAGGRTFASPLARRIAAERGLDIGELRGSGPQGRIVKRDVEEAITRGAALMATARPVAPAAPGAGAPEFEDIALTQLRKTIAKRLSESIGPIPTFYLTAEFDLTKVSELRAAMAEMGPEFKVSVNDIVLKAVATALMQHPEVNAHWLGDRMRRFNRVHLGMAVAIPDGLITPVIFDAHTKSLRQIASEARTLAGRARERKLQPHEFTGATCSVSNLGMFGIDQFTAIINPPEAAILAIGGLSDVPVVEGGQVVVRKRMRVTMSCDHRVIDGAIGAQFLQTLRRMIENPLMLVF